MTTSNDNRDIATRTEPTPSGVGPDIARQVQKDIEARALKGEETYGERLKPFNGRSALVDAYQEALDLCMYLRQLIYEDFIDRQMATGFQYE